MQCIHFRKYTCCGHTGWVRRLAILGDRMVSGSLDTTVRVWDLGTGLQVYTLIFLHIFFLTSFPCVLTSRVIRVSCQVLDPPQLSFQLFTNSHLCINLDPLARRGQPRDVAGSRQLQPRPLRRQGGQSELPQPRDLGVHKTRALSQARYGQVQVRQEEYYMGY